MINHHVVRLQAGLHAKVERRSCLFLGRRKSIGCHLTSGLLSPRRLPHCSNGVRPKGFLPAKRTSRINMASLQAAQTASTTNSNNSSPESTLRPVTSASGYVFPAIWSFPPFFTYVICFSVTCEYSFNLISLQPNPQTFAHQIGLWTQLLLSWAKFHRVFFLDAGAFDGGDCKEVFHNQAINSMSPSLATDLSFSSLLQEDYSRQR